MQLPAELEEEDAAAAVLAIILYFMVALFEHGMIATCRLRKQA
jgi:hypothetical protein